MPAPTLYDLAKTRLLQNISLLTDIGDLPYSFLAPILKHIQNPTQLADLEASCPQLLGETGEIWLRLIKRDIPNWDKKPHQPRDEKNWSKVYKKLKKESEREKEEQEQRLREQMRALQKDRQDNKTVIMEGKVAAPVRKSGWGGGSSWGRPTAPPKTGKMAFDKLRKSMFDQKRERPKASLMPTHLLEERRGKVAQVPARMERMRETDNSGSRPMVVSRGAAASVAAKSSRPTLRTVTEPAPGKPQHPSLPTGQQFMAPKVRPQGSGMPTGVKRRREEPAMFMAKKRRA